MKKLLLLCGLCGIIGCSKVNAQTELKVLQWNIWQEGTMVPGGYEAIVSEIARLEPDFVTFSEVRNYHQTRFCDRIVTSLREKGKTYYSFYSYDSGLLSKHPITDSTTVFPEKNDHGSIYRMVASVNGQQIAVYTAHLDYLSDAYYNVRGYDGSTWKEIPIPETVQEVLAINDASQRDDAIREFVKAAKKDIAEGRMVILGGDFNEPSHLDWTRETKDLYDHNGLIVPGTGRKSYCASMSFNFLQVTIYVFNIRTVCFLEQSPTSSVRKTLGFRQENIVVSCAKIKTLLGAL